MDDINAVLGQCAATRPGAGLARIHVLQEGEKVGGGGTTRGYGVTDRKVKSWGKQGLLFCSVLAGGEKREGDGLG